MFSIQDVFSFTSKYFFSSIAVKKFLFLSHSQRVKIALKCLSTSTLRTQLLLILALAGAGDAYSNSN